MRVWVTYIQAVLFFDILIWHKYAHTSLAWSWGLWWLTLMAKYTAAPHVVSPLRLHCFFNKKMFPLEPAKLITLQQEGIFCCPCFVWEVISVLCCGTSHIHSTRSAAVALSHTYEIHSGGDRIRTLIWIHLHDTHIPPFTPLFLSLYSYCTCSALLYRAPIAIVPLDGGCMLTVCSTLLDLCWVFKTAGGWSAGG